MARYADRLPVVRPPGLRLSSLRRPWYRLDAEAPARWTWQAHSTPRSRFDSASGTLRVRYAGDAQRVAMRERFDNSERVVRAADLDLHLVELTGVVHILDLRRERNLDALRLDDQISTSRAPGVWVACQRLVDLVHRWFGERCQGIVYRSRTTPQRSSNIAFFAHAPLTARSLGALATRQDLLAACVLSDGFTLQGWR